MMRKVIIAGGYDTSNLGDHAQLSVLLKGLRKYDSELDVVVLSRHPDQHFDQTYSVRSIQNLDHKSKSESIGRWLNGLNYNDDTNHLAVMRKELASADMLVLGGGRLFVDYTLGLFRGPLPYYALLVTLAKFFQIPIMIFGMTIIELKSAIGRELLQFIVSNADAITVREDSSKNVLLKLGIERNRIQVFPDPALGLERPDRKKEGYELLKQDGVCIKNPLLAMSVRALQTVELGQIDQDEDSFIKKMAWLCDEIIHSLDVDIIFVAQQTYGVDSVLVDDRNVANAIYCDMGEKKRAHVLKGNYSVDQTLAIYQVSDLLVAMRRHALVFARTQGVPGIALSGDPGIDAFMESIDQKDAIINIENIDLSLTLNKIKQIWETKAELCGHLEASLPDKRKCVGKYADIAWSLITRAETVSLTNK